jgi:inosine/xanthosine triphosphatase
MTPHPSRAHVRRVRVGTLNGPKLEAVRAAFGAYVDGFEVEGADVESGVPEQPVGFDEIVSGARQRAQAAFDGGACDFAVGIEDGLLTIAALGSDAVNVGAAAVTDGERTSVGLSSGFAYPTACGLEAMQTREAVGGLFDRLMDGDAPPSTPSSLTEGNIGRLSGSVLPRSEYGRHAVLCALVRFLHPALYDWTPGGEARPASEPGSRPIA